MKQRILKSIPVLLVYGTMVILYFFLNPINEQRKVEKVKIIVQNQNIGFLNAHTVENILLKKGIFLEAKLKRFVNLQKIEQVLKSNPYIKTSNCYLGLDNVLRIETKQHLPLFRVVGKKHFYVNMQGGKMPLSKTYSPRVLLFYGEDFADNLKEVSLIINEINQNPFLKKMIVSVEKSKKEGYLLRTRIYRQKIYLGEILDLKNKMLKLRVLYQKLIKDKKQNKFSEIFLKYKGQVVCK